MAFIDSTFWVSILDVSSSVCITESYRETAFSFTSLCYNSYTWHRLAQPNPFQISQMPIPYSSSPLLVIPVTSNTVCGCEGQERDFGAFECVWFLLTENFVWTVADLTFVIKKSKDDMQFWILLCLLYPTLWGPAWTAPIVLHTVLPQIWRDPNCALHWGLRNGILLWGQYTMFFSLGGWFVERRTLWVGGT